MFKVVRQDGRLLGTFDTEMFVEVIDLVKYSTTLDVWYEWGRGTWVQIEIKSLTSLKRKAMYKEKSCEEKTSERMKEDKDFMKEILSDVMDIPFLSTDEEYAEELEKYLKKTR